MPIYEYQCQSCGHAMEKLQKMSDDALTDCPACQQPELKKMISAASFQLKGSGWYESDFKNSKKPAAAKPAAAEAAASTAPSCAAGGCGCH